MTVLWNTNADLSYRHWEHRQCFMENQTVVKMKSSATNAKLLNHSDNRENILFLNATFPHRIPSVYTVKV